MLGFPALFHGAGRIQPKPSCENNTMYRLPRMLSRHAAAALLATAALVVAGTAYAEPVVFTLENNTGAVMDQFYASPPSSNEWEEDILGQDVLNPGESVEITIDDGREDCEYDFRAVFQDGSAMEHDAVHICDGETYSYE